MSKVYDDDFFCADISVEGGDEELLFLHCYYKKHPTKSNIKLARKEFKLLLERLAREGHTCLFAYTPSIKYVKMINQEYETLLTREENGKNMELIVWPLVH